jgi:hypothetical protein
MWSTVMVCLPQLNLDTKFDKKTLRFRVRIDDSRIFYPSSYSGPSLICLKKEIERLGRARIDDFWISTPLPFRSLGWKSRGRKSPPCCSLRRNYSLREGRRGKKTWMAGKIGPDFFAKYKKKHMQVCPAIFPVWTTYPGPQTEDIY